jgi:hypothetical protein
MTNTSRELNAAELDAVSGGMRWTRGTKNDDVIDARGQSSLMAGLVGAMAGGVGGAGSKGPK